MIRLQSSLRQVAAEVVLQFSSLMHNVCMQLPLFHSKRGVSSPPITADIGFGLFGRMFYLFAILRTYLGLCLAGFFT